MSSDSVFTTIMVLFGMAFGSFWATVVGAGWLEGLALLMVLVVCANIIYFSVVQQ